MIKNNKVSKRYFLLYYIETAITFISLIFLLIAQFDSYKYIGIVYDFQDFIYRTYLISGMAIISLIIFIVIIVLKIKRRKFYIDKLTFPISYIVFFAFMGLIMALFSRRVVENVHLTYYYSFIFFDYLLLSIYTLLCIKKK